MVATKTAGLVLGRGSTATFISASKDMLVCEYVWTLGSTIEQFCVGDVGGPGGVQVRPVGSLTKPNPVQVVVFFVPDPPLFEQLAEARVKAHAKTRHRLPLVDTAIDCPPAKWAPQ